MNGPFVVYDLDSGFISFSLKLFPLVINIDFLTTKVLTKNCKINMLIAILQALQKKGNLLAAKNVV